MNYIKIFQEKNGLVSDGIIGHNTLKKFSTLHKLSEEEVAHFFGQTAHESRNFTVGNESLYYKTTDSLRSTFYSPFKGKSDEFVRQYLRNSEKCANYVYSNRMGNGDEASGDGYLHRGYGNLQITGKNNQYEFADAVNDCRIKIDPSIIEKEYFFESGLFFFNQNKLWKYCKTVDEDSILKLSRAINLGNANSKYTPHGLEDRENKTKAFYKKIKR